MDDRNQCNLLSLAKYLSKNFTTRKLLTVEHMAIFVVKDAMPVSFDQICLYLTF